MIIECSSKSFTTDYNNKTDSLAVDTSKFDSKSDINESNSSEVSEYASFGGGFDLYDCLVYTSVMSSCCCCCCPELIGDCVQGNACENGGFCMCILRLMCCQYKTLRQYYCLPHAAIGAHCLLCYACNCFSLCYSKVRVNPMSNSCYRNRYSI